MGIKKYQFDSMIGLFLHEFLANTVHFCNYKGNHCPQIHGFIRSPFLSITWERDECVPIAALSLSLALPHTKPIKMQLNRND